MGFRAFVLHEAHALALRGYTRNLYDGSVEVVAVGEETMLERLIARLRTGPALARVDAVEESPIDPPPDVTDFEVRG